MKTNETKTGNANANVNVNLFTKGANLTAKNLISEKSAVKKANKVSFADVATALDGALNQLVKSTDKRSRDTANTLKSKFKTAVNIVASCYPYQTKDGILLKKTKIENEDGTITRVFTERVATAQTIKAILRLATENYINKLYTKLDLIETHEINEIIPD